MIQTHYTKHRNFIWLKPVHMLQNRVTLFILLFCMAATAFSRDVIPQMHYTVSFPEPASHRYDVLLQCSEWQGDSIHLKMPAWMPGYYQLMNYAGSVEKMTASGFEGKSLTIKKLDATTWGIYGIHQQPFEVRYTILTDKKFVANSYVDSLHAYLIPENSFLYIAGKIDLPVSVSIDLPPTWKNIATGLEPVSGQPTHFTATDFDILYDCPILIGNLTSLPSFWVDGKEHRFMGYEIGKFDQVRFMNELKKIVIAASNIIGDIPYQQYTFIGIGPGRGGIEHLNNTTISFDGSGLDQPAENLRLLHFIAHEYFHHYNVKRIRPFELGPFDYDHGSRTNLLWISEGLTVYYEYLVVKRAGLSDEKTLLASLETNLNATENNPGRLYQSLQQASYDTWSDGPFGTNGPEKGKTISYYDKGPLIGMLLDFEIRNATQNKKSLDDVMRLLYNKYYLQAQRGFTAAEFQHCCEQIAGKPLPEIFEYIYTTKEPDYNKYLAYAGLQISTSKKEMGNNNAGLQYSIQKTAHPTALQQEIYTSWLGE